MQTNLIRRLFCVVAICLFATSAKSADYPVRPIHIIVTFSPGGSADTLARIVGQKLNEAWGQPVIVENRPGLGGNLGATEVAHAAPDGYTLLILTTAHCISQALYNNLSYKLERDFAPITQLSTSPLIMVTYPGIPVRSVPELVDWAKTNHLIYASGGAGTLGQLAMEMFKRAAKIDAIHVPYKGSPPSLPDLAAGRVQVETNAIPELYPFVQAGKLRAIGLMASKRSAKIPDLPTFSEQGYPDFVITNWAGIAAPAGTPAPVLNKLAQEITRILNSPAITKQLEEQGFDPVGGTPGEFTRFVHAEVERFEKAVKDTGITIQ